MENNDTVKLLIECNSGIKMGEDAIKKVLPRTKSRDMREALESTKNTHASLADEAHAELKNAGAATKDPHPIARMMSGMKIRTKMMMNPSDKTVAHLMTDGCDMGIKSIYSYLNEYPKASRASVDIAKRLIASEEYLEAKMRKHL
ncbi:MAG: hypothetical protein IJ488_08435 [Clostridia bacterium]|nr:hypothetical protein [Clostridia bacterium]